MPSKRSLIHLPLIAILAAGAAIADEPGVGTRVRVLAPAVDAGPLTGAIVAADAASLTLRAEGRTEPVRVPRAGISKLEVSEGRSSRIGPALLGAVLGAGAGYAIGSHGTQFQSAKEATAGLGALVGAGVGALFPTTERWRELPAPTQRVSVVARPDLGAGIGIVFAF